METASRTKIAPPLFTHLLVFAIRHVVKIRFRPLCRGASWQAAAANFPNRLQGLRALRCVVVALHPICILLHCIAEYCLGLMTCLLLFHMLELRWAAYGYSVPRLPLMQRRSSILLQSLGNLLSTLPTSFLTLHPPSFHVRVLQDVSIR